jgi:trehalose-phosphatase
MAGLRQEMERLLGAYRAGRTLALLFDYDGTLVPIVQHPALARLPAETRALLEELSGQPHLIVGVLSGRRIEDLKERVGLPLTLPSPPAAGGEGRVRGRICYCGVSGMELELHGVRITHPQATQGYAVIARLSVPLRELAAAYPGAWVEDKGLGLTLHYRAAPPHRIEDLRAHAQQIFQSWAGELRILEVAMAMEITPAFGWTKGSAVQRIVTSAGRDAIPLYAGDEANDRDALETAAALGGVAIGVGPRAPSSADYRLPDPAALLSLLHSFREALGLPASCGVLPGGRARPSAGRNHAAG